MQSRCSLVKHANKPGPSRALYRSMKLFNCSEREGCRSLRKLCFDLANSLARHGELTPNLFKRVIGIHINTESHSEHLCRTLGQRPQHIVGRLTQPFIRCLIKRRLNRSVAAKFQIVESSSSPTGVSSDIGCFAASSALMTLSCGSSIFSLSSSMVADGLVPAATVDSDD